MAVMRNVAALSLLCVLVGCSQTRTYDVSVTNRTDRPITVALIKEGGPYQPEWASPEDVAIRGQPVSQTSWKTLPPGRTADTGTVKGKFYRDARVDLRVYQGNLGLSQMLAVDRDAPNRLDLPVQPGANRFVVTDADGRFTALRDEAHNRRPPQ